MRGDPVEEASSFLPPKHNFPENEEERPLTSRNSHELSSPEDEYSDAVSDDENFRFGVSAPDLRSSSSQHNGSSHRNDQIVESNSASVTLSPPEASLPYAGSVQGSSAQLVEEQVDLELQVPELTPSRPLSYRQRLVNVARSIFPVQQTYDRLSNGITTGRLQANTPGRFIGLGTDGVFRNLAAKPDRELEILRREQHPPTYEEAAADASPEYWEIGVVNPVFEDEVFVRGLPVGTFGNLLWNALMTIAFKMVAFVLCYLLHTSHAAKEGTRIGFGAMLIMYGYNILPTNFGSSKQIPPRYQPVNANTLVSKALLMKIGGPLDTYVLDIPGLTQVAKTIGGTHEPYLAYGVIAFGLFTIFMALYSFMQVKRDEKMMLAPPPQQEQHSTTEPMMNVPE